MVKDTAKQPAAIKRLLSEQCDKAHKAELDKAMEELHGHLADWKAGKIDSFELSDIVHHIHDGVIRNLYTQYSVMPLDEPWLVSLAISKGILRESEVPAELASYLKEDIAKLRVP